MKDKDLVNNLDIVEMAIKVVEQTGTEIRERKRHGRINFHKSKVCMNYVYDIC